MILKINIEKLVNFELLGAHMPRSSNKFSSFALGADIYGHQIGVNYEGNETYKTGLGVTCTLLVYTLMLANIIIMSIAF